MYGRIVVDPILNSLLSGANAEQVKGMLSANSYAAFQEAIQRCDWIMINTLWTKATPEQRKVVWNSINAVVALQLAIEYRNFKKMDSLWAKATSEQKREMRTSIDYVGAFQEAVKSGDSRMVDSLWSKASLEQQQEMLNANNYGAFQEAVKSGYSWMVESLWSKASTEHQQEMLSENSYGAFQEAVQSGSFSMVDSLWKTLSPKQQKEIFSSLDDEKLKAAFQKAVGYWQKNIELACMLQKKAKPEQCQVMWISINPLAFANSLHWLTKNMPLQIFAQQCYLEIVRLLLDNGVGVSARGEYRNTAFHLAAQEGKLVQLLLEKDAGMEAKDNNNWTSLHLAAYKGHKEVLQQLIEKGADIMAIINSGHTLL